MKRFRFLSLLFAIIFTLFSPITEIAYAIDSPPDLNSEGVVLINSDTKQVVFDKNGDKKLYPASTTKILTALIVIENCDLSEKVTVGHNPAYAEGSSIGLKEGEIFTVKELLTGLILLSGNDCALALAEHVSGSGEEFAKLMNKRAKELGANDSNFMNPSGLPDEKHYTTAHDLALIMCEASKNKTFVDICQTKSLKMSPSNLDGTERWLNNKNYILFPESKYYYEYSFASKKGYTIAANFTNVIACTKNGTTYCGAFLNGENIDKVYSDVKNIFNYVFDNYSSTSVYKEGEELDSVTLNNDKIPLLVGSDVYYTTPNDDKDSYNKKITYDLPKNLSDKSFKRGDTLTTGTVYIDGTEYSEVPIVAGSSYNLDTNSEATTTNNSTKTKWVIGILLTLFLLFILRVIMVNRRRKKRRLMRAKKMQELSKALNESRK